MGRMGGTEYTAAVITEGTVEDEHKGTGEKGEVDKGLERPARGRPKRQRQKDGQVDPVCIVFQEPAIEEETRRILEQPEGDITVESVLGIKRFAVRHEKVDSLADLRWFSDLEDIAVLWCDLKSLEGIEGLENLEKLDVRNNRITSLEPIRDLKNLKELNCLRNCIEDYGPLEGLVKMERLSIGDDNSSYTDLSPIAGMKNLNYFSGMSCGISDISALKACRQSPYRS